MVRASGDQVKELCTPDEVAFMSCAAFGEHRMVMAMYGKEDSIGPMLASLLVQTVKRAGLDEGFLFATFGAAISVLRQENGKEKAQ